VLSLDELPTPERRVQAVMDLTGGFGADLVADGLKAMSHRPVPTNPHEVPLKSPDGSPFFVSDPLPLPVDRARFVGEPVAMVVAETALAARDGAERVTVEWEPLPAVVTSTDAIAAGAVAVWDACASNVAVETEAGDATATDAAFARAAHVVTLDSRINRVTGVPMEPRAAVGDFDASTGRYTVYAGSGGSWRIRNDVAVVLGVPPESVRVIAREVGGSYGTRNPCYPEYPLVAWAARRVRRPVKWTGDRRESLISDCHARDLVVHAELALDADGTFLAYRAFNTSNVGAHTLSFIPLAKGIGISTSVYHVPAASLRGRAVLSNTAPTFPYRAAGRPEIMYIIERLVDLAARIAPLQDVERRISARLFPLRDQPADPKDETHDDQAPKHKHHQHHPDSPRSPDTPHRVAPPVLVGALLRPRPDRDPHAEDPQGQSH